MDKSKLRKSVKPPRPATEAVAARDESAATRRRIGALDDGDLDRVSGGGSNTMQSDTNPQ